jgi:hypothetical protein
MSMLSSRLVDRLRHRADPHTTGEPLFEGTIGFTADTVGWDRSHQRLSESIDEATARSRHVSGRPWSCVMRSSGRVIVVANHTTGEVKVSRYDSTDSFVVEIREFRPVDDRLWLRSIKRMNGDERTTPTDEMITDWFTWVRPATTATWTRFDHRSPQGRAEELRLDWDADANWYDLPEWGQLAQFAEPSDLLARLWPESTALPVLTR